MYIHMYVYYYIDVPDDFYVGSAVYYLMSLG